MIQQKINSDGMLESALNSKILFLYIYLQNQKNNFAADRFPLKIFGSSLDCYGCQIILPVNVNKSEMNVKYSSIN